MRLKCGIFWLSLFCINSVLCLNITVTEYYPPDYNESKIIDYLEKNTDEDVEYRSEGNKNLYTFGGFEKLYSIPVLFPKDICVFKIGNDEYAASLHLDGDGQQYFKVIKYQNNDFIEIYSILTPFAISMDCEPLDDRGYVTLVYNFTETVEVITDGSPIFEIFEDYVSSVQYFTTANISSSQLRIRGDDMFLLQTITSNNVKCPIYLWRGSHFDFVNDIPCDRAKQIDPFIIDSDLFVAVANYADRYGKTETFSEIYIFDVNLGEFVLFQQISTFAAVDVKYFEVLSDEMIKLRFIVFANSKTGSNQENNLESNSIIYKYEQNQFVPFQRLLLYAVKQFLPVQSAIGKFIMLISCENQPTKFFEFNGQKFVEAGAQLTEGALGIGVSKMRTFKTDNETHIVIANENMLEDEINMYKPVFKEQQDIERRKQEIFQWAEKMHKELSEMNLTDIKARIENVNKARNEDSADIEEIITKTLIHPAKNMTSDYWKTLSLIEKATKFLSERLAKIEKKNETLLQSTLEDDTLTVDTLIVKNKLIAKRVNNLTNAEINVDEILANKIIVHGKLITNNEKERTETLDNLKLDNNIPETLKINDLTISGKINGFDIEEIDKYALRKTGDQKILGSLFVSNLATKETIISNGLMNGINISKLILTNEGNFVINQDIQFSAPIKARNVTVNERIDNINVVQGQLDVLLTNSDQPQIITGTKTFETVELMEPITILGKITGKNLDKVRPIITIEDDIILQGDYEINGEVFIKDLLKTDNIFGSTQNRSIQRVYEEGLRIDSPVEINIDFQQPIQAENAILTIVNGVNISDLVKTNTTTDNIQIITGHKIFKGDLFVSGGFCEAANINGINVDNLEKSLFLKNVDQNITGKIHFKKIHASNIFAEDVIMGSNQLSDLLTTSTPQTVYGQVIVDSLQADLGDIDEFFSNKQIFEIDLQFILEDTAVKDNQVVINGQKTFLNNINAQHLIVHKSINEKSVDAIEQVLTQLEGNIKYVGTTHFQQDISISSLTFEGSFNNITAKEFGNCWMLSKLDQEFTAPQTFSSINCFENTVIEGFINNYSIEDLVNNTYWINRPEHIERIIFEDNVIAEAPITASGTINGIHFSDEVLLQNSTITQFINGPLNVDKDVYVTGNIKMRNLNNLNIQKIEDIFNYPQSEIFVDKAYFEYPPIFTRLNSIDWKNLMNEVWWADRDVVLKQNITFNKAIVLADTFLGGLLNDVDLKYLVENYFSLSTPQQITTPIKFMNTMQVDNVFSSPRMHLKGSIADLTSDYEVNFNYFLKNTLTINDDQIITGNWNIKHAIVHGNLENVHINGLRLFDDVAHHGMEFINITAPKFIQSLFVSNLYCEPGSTVNQVDISEWIRKAVFVYDNYTIQGTTYIDTAILYNDVIVLGLVNNVSFEDNIILLKDKEQTIRGNLYVGNKYLESQQIQPLTIENLYVNTFNTINVSDFFTNLIEINKNISIQGNLAFENPVKTDYLDSNQYLYDIDLVDLFKQMEIKTPLKNATTRFNQLKSAIESIKFHYKDPQYYLSHFEKKQFIPGEIKKIVAITLPLETGYVDAIAVLHRMELLHVSLYKWKYHKQIFLEDTTNDFGWYTNGQEIVDISGLSFQDADFLIIETFYNGNYYQHVITGTKTGLQKVLQLNSDSSRKITSLQHNGNECFILYSEYNPHIPIFCLVYNKQSFEFAPIESLYINMVRQIITSKESFIIALLPESVEIFKPGASMELLQTIPILNAVHISATEFDGNNYLAVCTKPLQNSLHYGSVQIYRSTNNSYYEFMQSIEIVAPIQTEFSLIKESDDFLLYILTDNPAYPLLVYLYRGVVGFKQRVKQTTLVNGNSINLLHLKFNKKYFASVISSGGATFVESVIKNV